MDPPQIRSPLHMNQYLTCLRAAANASATTLADEASADHVAQFVLSVADRLYAGVRARNRVREDGPPSVPAAPVPAGSSFGLQSDPIREGT